MGGGHVHVPNRTEVGRKLLLSTVATGIFVGVELGAGIYANSLALVSDAAHNFTDAIALLLALVAVRLARRPATHTKSFGYHRAGVLAAFINAGTLVGFTVYIFLEAWDRFLFPEPVDSFWMLVIASIALVLNTAITLWLRQEGKSDLSVRAALVHMLGDALSSAGIIVAALLMRATGLTVIDPIISVIIGGMILWSSWGILKEAVNLLLEGTPAGIDPLAVMHDLSVEEGVLGVHHLHIWALAPSRPSLSCHIQLGDVSLKSTGPMLARVSTMLSERYGITHTTIQFEHAGCPVDDPLCIIESGKDHAT